MGDYPYRLDKAALKFAPQDRKISQIVSVIITVFHSNFSGNIYSYDSFLSHAKRLLALKKQTYRKTLRMMRSPRGAFFSGKTASGKIP
jgi:hypothetical protein